MGNWYDFKRQECREDLFWSSLASNTNWFSSAWLDNERIPATISDVIEHLSEKPITAGRWWVARFIDRHETELTVQKASVVERPGTKSHPTT
jgi:hypothetical protein